MVRLRTTSLEDPAGRRFYTRILAGGPRTYVLFLAVVSALFCALQYVPDRARNQTCFSTRHPIGVPSLGIRQKVDRIIKRNPLIGT